MEKLNFLPDSKLEANEEINIFDYIVSPDEEVPEPIPILSVKENGYQVPIFTEENISLVFGPAKSRKSTLIKAICQAVINGENEKMTSYYSRNDIAIIDTEQSKYHCYKAVKVLKMLTGRSVKYYSVAGTTKEQKKQLVERHLTDNPGCGFLVLDNIVHFLKDFNSVDESSDITEWLVKIKKDYNVHILCVLHENASGGVVKPRGHLGTNLMNLCETILKIEKDSNDKTQSIISAFLTRGRPFDDFCITMDYQGTPFLSDLQHNGNKRFAL